ncbi:MAG: hypothetical protein PHQ23_06415 [Candidatus Wallbacteria bacterium]|nr:hypothetical protein [Candidatus Wallbacteria bacterium]
MHTTRPDSHYRRIQADRETVNGSLFRKILHGNWLSTLGRQRQKYWFKGFIRQASRFANVTDNLPALEKLIADRIIPATHSLKYFAMNSGFG